MKRARPVFANMTAPEDGGLHQVTGVHDRLQIPPDRLPPTSKGTIYAARRQFGEAIDQYQRALTIDPGNAVANYRLGQALARAGDNAGAQKEFSEFERLRKQQVTDDQKRNASIQQFVYTMRNPGASLKQQQ